METKTRALTKIMGIIKTITTKTIIRIITRTIRITMVEIPGEAVQVATQAVKAEVGD